MLVVAVRILETIFVVGVIGCVAVLALTAVEDIRTLFGRDDVDARDNQRPNESGAVHYSAEKFNPNTIPNH